VSNLCGIFGSNDKRTFAELAKKNASRGDFASGFLSIFDNGLRTHKQSGVFEESSIPNDAKYYLGHVRAPTNSTLEYKSNETHPFSLKDAYYWAHNGILSKNGYDSLEVDSKLIGILYAVHKGNWAFVLPELNGTYGIWLYDTYNQKIYLTRGDNTLYYSDYAKSFSSCLGFANDIKLLGNNEVWETSLDLIDFKRSDVIVEGKKQKYFIPTKHE